MKQGGLWKRFERPVADVVDMQAWQAESQDGVVVNWDDGSEPRIRCRHLMPCPSADVCFERIMRQCGLKRKRR